MRYETALNSIIRNDWGFGKSCSRYPRSKNVKKLHSKTADLRWNINNRLINIEVKSRERVGWTYNTIQETKCNYRLVNTTTGEVYCYVLEQSAMHQLVVNNIIPIDIIDLPDHNNLELHKWFDQSSAIDIVALIRKTQSYVFFITEDAYDFFIYKTKEDVHHETYTKAG